MTQRTTTNDYFWNTIGVLSQNAVSPLLLIFITRINGIADSGLFSFAFAVSIILFAFGLWGGRTYQVSDSKKEFDHRSYIVARVVLGVLMIVAALGFSLLNEYDSNKTLLIAILVIYKAIESIADAVFGVLQAHGKLSYVGKSLLYKSVGGLLLFILIDSLTHNIITSSISLILVNLVFLVFYDVRLAKHREELNIPVSRIFSFICDAVVILSRTWPILAITFLATFSINIPRFFIDKYDPSQIGYFGIIAVPITLIAVFMSFILQPNIVTLTKLYEKARYQAFNSLIKKIIGITLGFGVVVATMAYIVGVPVLNLIFGIDFSSHNNELMIMIVGGIANAVVAVFISIFTIIRKFKAQFYTLVATNFLLIALSQIFVQSYGMFGGAIVFSVVSIFQMITILTLFNFSMRQAARKRDR